MRSISAALVGLCIATPCLAQDVGAVDTRPDAAIVRPSDTDTVVNLPGLSGVLPALPLRDARNNPIGYSLPVSISARPANLRNTIGQLTGALVGSPQAENSRVMYLYDIGSNDEFSKLVHAVSGRETPFLAYVLARNQGDASLRGAPVVFLPDTGASWESGVPNLSQASRIANEAISWGIPKGLSESGALESDGRLLLAVPTEIPGLARPEKVLTSGTADWNVYSDVKSLTDALAVAPRE